MKIKDQRLTRNAAKCNKCNGIVESAHRHHYVECSCGAIAVDGGLAYARRTGNPEDCTNLCEYEEYEREEYDWEIYIRKCKEDVEDQKALQALLNNEGVE